MKAKNYIALAILVIVGSAFTFVSSMNWKVSSGHSVKFSGTEVEGVFKTMKGDVKFNPANVSNAKFSFTIDVNSINTGNGMKNKHAIGKKWFEAGKYPTITFNSSSFSKEGSQYKVTGNLKMHGVTKKVTIPFTFKNNAFHAKFSVKRMDYKIGTMEGMSKKVSDKINLNVSIPVKK